MAEVVMYKKKCVCMLQCEPTYFCSSLTKSEQTWPCLEEFKVEAKECFCCINIDGTSI